MGALSANLLGSGLKTNNIGADQTVGMTRLVCALLFTNPKDRFSRVEANLMF